MRYLLRWISGRLVVASAAALAVFALPALSGAASLNFEQANLHSSRQDCSTPSVSLGLGNQPVNVCGYVGVNGNGDLSFSNFQGSQAPSQGSSSPLGGSDFGSQGPSQAQPITGIVQTQDQSQLASPQQPLSPSVGGAGNGLNPLGFNGNACGPAQSPSQAQNSLWGEACGSSRVEYPGSTPIQPSYGNPQPKAGPSSKIPGWEPEPPHHATFVPLPAPLAAAAALLGMFALLQFVRMRRARPRQIA